MVTANKLEKDRIDKLRNLSTKESTEYIESLVLDLFKDYKNGEISDNPDAENILNRLDEFRDISLRVYPENNNINAVINDRKMIYLAIAYLSAVYSKENLKIDLFDLITFITDLSKLEIYFYHLKGLLRIYYKNYSNYGFMEDLLMELDDDGVTINADIHEKYAKSNEYRFNQQIMNYLDIEIKTIVDLIFEEMDRLDAKYLADNTAKINEYIDGIHRNIKNFYKNNGDFEISVYKQCGLLDAEMKSIESLKNDSNKNKKSYLRLKNNILDFINGNGFSDLSADKFELYKKIHPDDNFDLWMENEPKYNVRDAKFIYPENTES